MKKINADTFFASWEKFSKDFEKNPLWIDAYENNTAWSNLFLGGKKSLSDRSPIGNFFEKEFEEHGLHYRTEDGSFDISFFTAANYKMIPYLNRNKILFEDKDSYPTSYDIIVEIENDYVGAWQEMAKLTWIRCPLKVLVTYNNKSGNENEMLRQTFSTIISQSNTTFKENQDTEYLLLIGNKDNKKLTWKAYKFDTKGQEK